MKSGCQWCALAPESSHALGISLRKITHTSTSIWAMPARSSAPIALRYSVSIRAWVHAKLIRQIVLTLTRTELKSSNAASLVMLPEANHHRQARSSSSAPPRLCVSRGERADGVVRDSGLPDVAAPSAFQHAVEDLSPETLVFLLGSRYCETDRPSDVAWSSLSKVGARMGACPSRSAISCIATLRSAMSMRARR